MQLKIPPIVHTYLAKLKPIAKHHYFIVVVIIMAGLAFAVYTVNQTLSTPSDTTYQSKQLQQTIGTQFNASTNATSKLIQTLKTSSDTQGQQQSLPPGRINPFAE